MENQENEKIEDTENYLPEEMQEEDINEFESSEDITKYQEEIQELKSQLLRALADNDNIRKRSQRELEESSKYAVTAFARDIVSVSENLFRALDSIPAENIEEGSLLANLRGGVEMTFKELISTMEKHGIRRINPEGDKFDHNYHQAISQVEVPNVESGTVVQVLQAGYTIADRLLRPALVVVAKSSAPNSNSVDTQA